jgi:hypothetical protein
MAFHYSPKIVTNGLVLYLDAANTKSFLVGDISWRDLSGKYNNGELTNGATYSSGSIYFDGIDDYISGTLSSTLYVEPNSDVTIETFLYPYGLTNSPRIFNLGRSGNAFNYGMRIGNTGILKSNNSLSDSDLGGTVSVNNWNHLTITFTPQGSTGYLNGYIIGTNSVTTGSVNLSYMRNWVIGRRAYDGLSGASEFFYGKIGLFKIYKRSLSSTEILQNYNALKSRFGL